ncbi:c-type cytochrome [Leptospirillum ferriphilum]|uniref:Cytochrome C n=2 Tax=Leptospirillum ferriphilum TaxID=178606 RepID=A0A1V3SZN4_9BACT|nr:c-type cytochrome [Leptospirillum ferriphilum]AFS53205.1 putative cytochrome C, class I [Leptospirillum ferriphilum ML-04]OOH75189.1 cytochrome C [Leptospirillum ferriphilum]
MLNRYRFLFLQTALAVMFLLGPTHIVLSSENDAGVFHPPGPGEYPPGPLGDLVRKGEKIFTQTGTYAPRYTGNSLTCVSCHLDAGRKPYAAPMWAAYVHYPRFDEKKNALIQLNDRIRACFRNSLHGTPPPANGETVRALNAYIFWLAKGAPVGLPLKGQGFRTIAMPKQDSPLFRGPHILRMPDTLKGMTLYQNRCASCHGMNGQGNRSFGGPPVWGARSYPVESGFHSVRVLAEFLKMNMPPGDSNRLTDQESWDIAAYVASQPRPR